MKKVLFTTFAFLAVLTAAAGAVNEKQVKALFVIHFSRFVQWPDSDGPLKVGVLGDRAMRKQLAVLSNGRQVNGREIEVVFFEHIAGIDEYVNVLFLPEKRSWQLGKVSEKTAGRPVLLVSESEGLATQGAHINFIIREDRVRFEINQSAIAEAGMKISSQVLKLAYKVY